MGPKSAPVPSDTRLSPLTHATPTMTMPARPIPTTDLRPGQVLARDLVDGRGRVLLRAFEPVTEPVIALAEAAGTRLEHGEIGEAAVEPMTRLVSLTQADGEELMQRRAAHRHWQIDRGLALVRSQIRRTAEAAIAQRRARWARLDFRIQPDPSGGVEGRARDRLVQPSAAMSDSALLEWREDRGAILAQAYARLAAGHTIRTAVLDAIIDECLDDLSAEPRLAVRLAVGAARGRDALVAHALGVGVLAMGVAIGLGWSRDDVRSAGLAGLLSDVGLTVLATNLRALDRPLTEEEGNAMRRHPAYGAAMLERVRASTPETALPEAVQIAVYQHHERLDGSGYPDRVRGERLHDLARVVGACDVLLALCEDRAHRPGLTPEAALVGVVRMANAGQLDKSIVRAVWGLMTGAEVRVTAGRERVRAS